MTARGEVVWRPAADAGESTRIGRYLRWLAEERGRAFAGYDELWRWSVDDLDGFWRSVWDHFGLESATDPGPALAGGDRSLPGALWFPGARLNYATHALRAAPDGPAVIARSQSRGRVELSLIHI